MSLTFELLLLLSENVDDTEIEDEFVFSEGDFGVFCPE